MNNGLLKAFGNRWQAYTPRLITDATQPTYGTPFGSFGLGGSGRFQVIDGWCVGSLEFFWGSGGSAGTGSTASQPYQVELPVRASSMIYGQAGGSVISADYEIGSAYAVDAGNTGLGAPGFMYVSSNVLGGHPERNDVGKWAQINLNTFIASGTATVNSGAQTATVTHGLASAPTKVLIQPSASTVSSQVRSWWPSSIGTSTFTLNATAFGATTNVGTLVAATNLAANQTFDWQAFYPSGTFGPTLPFIWGGLLAHIEAVFSYPVA